MRTRLSICRKKRRYPSRDIALDAARSADLRMRAYRCDRCFQFHLSSRIKAGKPR